MQANGADKHSLDLRSTPQPPQLSVHDQAVQSEYTERSVATLLLPPVTAADGSDFTNEVSLVTTEAGVTVVGAGKC